MAGKTGLTGRHERVIGIVATPHWRPATLLLLLLMLLLLLRVRSPHLVHWGVLVALGLLPSS